MANPMIQKMMMEMFMQEQEEARLQEQAAKRGEAMTGFMGGAAQPAGAGANVPYQMSPEELMPGETQEQALVGGLMGDQAPSQPAQGGGLMSLSPEVKASGMYREDVPLERRYMDLASSMVGSSMPGLQKQGYDVLEKLQASQFADTGTSAINASRFDPNSPESLAQQAFAKERFPDKDWAGQSADMIAENMRSIQAKQRIDARPEAATVKFERRKEELDLLNVDRKTGATHKELLPSYREQQDQSRKFAPTMKKVNRLTELLSTVDTGPLVGASPTVYLRKMFPGASDLQEMEALIMGLPLPVLKETFGAQFTEVEGRKLSDSLANIRMDAPAFRRAMERMKGDLIHNQKLSLDMKKHLMETQDLSTYSAPASFPEFKEGQKIRLQDGTEQVYRDGFWENI